MNENRSLAGKLIAAGFGVAVGVPDSGLCEVVRELSESIPVHYTPREDTAVAFACGLSVGSRRPLVFMKNAGLFTAGDALVSLAEDLGLGLCLLVGWAGSGSDRLPHHRVTGDRTLRFLDALGITSHLDHDGQDFDIRLRLGCERALTGAGHHAILVSPH